MVSEGNSSEMDDQKFNVGTQVTDPRTAEFIKELMKEKMNLDPLLHPNALRLLEEEIVKAQKGKTYRDTKGPVDLYRERPIRAVVKVQVPVKEHPRFNFVGKLLGPKGNSLKRLQEETMTKMAILGRGSMRDKQKEEECRASLDPKYSHLSDELHVEIAALAPPAEAHARLAFALAELRKYLVPDANDEIRMEQLREIEAEGGPNPRRPQVPPSAPPHRNILPRPPNSFVRRPAPAAPPAPMMPPVPPQPPMGGGPPGPPPMMNRGGPGKAKVMSILDRARMAMEDNYPPQYDPPMPEPGFGYEHNGGTGEYYDQGYQDPAQAGRWKGYKSGGPPTRFSSARPTPYTRPTK